MRNWKVIAGLVAASVLTLACEVKTPTGDTNPRPSLTVHCNDTPAGCPMKTGHQPAPSGTAGSK